MPLYIPKASRLGSSQGPDFLPTQSNDIWILESVEDQMSPKGEEKIVKEKAICRHCWAKLVEDDKLLKSVCDCSNALVHVRCADRGTRKEGNICEYCGNKVHNVAVSLHGMMNTTQGVKMGMNKKTTTRTGGVKTVKKDITTSSGTRGVDRVKNKNWRFCSCCKM